MSPANELLQAYYPSSNSNKVKLLILLIGIALAFAGFIVYKSQGNTSPNGLVSTITNNIRNISKGLSAPVNFGYFGPSPPSVPTINLSRSDDRSIAVATLMFDSAVDRYYAQYGKFPWNNDFYAVPLSDTTMTQYIDALRRNRELPQFERVSRSNLERIYISSHKDLSGGKVTLSCFLPTSDEYLTRTESQYDRYGNPSPQCSDSNNRRGKECYWCI